MSIITPKISIMAKSAWVHQVLVSGSTLLAALPVGCSVGYPSVLLQQLSSNDSSIELDWDTSSWIGSIHGIAAVPSIIIPAFMQWRGRKIAFVVACLISIIGWILTYTASSSRTILISESVHGFGSQSIMAVGMLSMSEMLSPQTRSVSMGLYLVMQTLGMALVGIMGSYLHWRTACLIISAPLIVVTTLVACMWPESPAWLAYRGEFSKCAKSFTLLRGTGDRAQTELEELILAQKENLTRKKENKTTMLRHFWQTLKSRDFYLPALHITVLLQTPYWSGCMAHIIYASDIIFTATHSKDAAFVGSMVFGCTLFVCCILSIILIRYIQPKKLLLVSLSLTAVGLLSASSVNYSQFSGLLKTKSNACLYLLVGYMFSISLVIPIIYTVTAELMPVKHRGIGGPFYVIISCIMHTSSLKATPYMIKYLSLWGTWLIFALNAIICGLFIWKNVPETKGKTLQQLEDYYNYGNFDKHRKSNVGICISELLPVGNCG